MIKVAGLWHCVGRGGGDGVTLAIVSCTRTLKFTGVALSSDARHSPLDIKRAKEWAGFPGVESYHELKPQNMSTPIPGIQYHDTPLSAALTACEGADVVLAWGYPLEHIAPGITVPIVEVVQGMDEFATPIAHTNAPYSDVKIVVSEAVGAHVYGAKWPYAVVPNGANPMRVFPSLPGARKAIRKAWGIAEDEKVILQIQRMTSDKNVAAGIQAINQFELQEIAGTLQGINATPSKFKLVMMGSGPPAEEIKVKEMISRFTKPGKVLWVQDCWSPIGDILAAADVFLLASESEGWSVAVMEAMLAQVPCVLAANWSHNEMVEKFGNIAVLTPLNPSPSELAAAVQEALKPSNRVNLAYEMVKNYNTISTVTSQYENIIEDCLTQWRYHLRHPKVWRNPPEKRNETNVNLPGKKDSIDNPAENRLNGSSSNANPEQ